MTFHELQHEVSQYIYSEDKGMFYVPLASIVATRRQLGSPVWLIVIGASSSGKSQILRPLAMTDAKFIHEVDDLTENTLLSGIRVKEDAPQVSLLKRIGKLGIMIISDFTVIFSKGVEAKNMILGQLRMVYDGKMTKYSGVNPEPMVWEGQLGLIAGSTPAIYAHFEEVADMGERFVYYRMKSYDAEKAMRIAMERTVYGKTLDSILSDLYKEYIKSVVEKVMDEQVPPIAYNVAERIIYVSMLAALLRTPTHYDKYAKVIDRIPVPEMPMRIGGELTSVIKGMMCMHYHDTGSWDLEEEQIQYIEWCAYSLANEERRACLKILAGQEYGGTLRTQTVADEIGLSTTVISMHLQHLSAVHVVERNGTGDGLIWKIKEKSVWDIIRRLEGIDVSSTLIERELSSEEGDELQEAQQTKFDEIF